MLLFRAFFLLLKTIAEIRGIHEFTLEEKHFRTSWSSHWMCSVRKGVLRNFAKFTGKHLCQSLFFNKVAGLRPAVLLKKRLWHRCFPVNLAKFVRTVFERTPLGDCFWTSGNYFLRFSCQKKQYFVSLKRTLNARQWKLILWPVDTIFLCFFRDFCQWKVFSV